MEQGGRTFVSSALHAVWGVDKPDSDALRTHIHALRQALDKPFSYPMILTVTGAGFRLAVRDA